MIWKKNHIVSPLALIIQRIMYYLLLKNDDMNVNIKWKYNIDGKTVLIISTRYFAVQFKAVLEITRAKYDKE